VLTAIASTGGKETRKAGAAGARCGKSFARANGYERHRMLFHQSSGTKANAVIRTDHWLTVARERCAVNRERGR